MVMSSSRSIRFVRTVQSSSSLQVDFSTVLRTGSTTTTTLASDFVRRPVVGSTVPVVVPAFVQYSSYVP